jgi:hypothetical protein
MTGPAVPLHVVSDGGLSLICGKKKRKFKKNDVIGDENLRAYCKYRAG